jgi:hypothetical protein
MVSSPEIVQKIHEYLDGKCDLDTFRLWMVRAHLEMQGEKAKGPVDPEASALLAHMELTYAQFSDEIIPESSWKDLLRQYATPRVLLSANTPIYPQVNSLVGPGTVLQGSSVSFGTLPAVGYVLAGLPEA